MFGPGDDLPDWVLSAINNPDVWDGAVPPRLPEPEPVVAAGQGAADEVVRLHARIAELQSAAQEVDLLRARIAELEAAAALAGPTAGADDGTEPESATAIPPRGGPGSGAPEWRDYARSRGVEVSDDASREDVIAALEAAGKPTK
jgi:hypothetical protein